MTIIRNTNPFQEDSDRIEVESYSLAGHGEDGEMLHMEQSREIGRVSDQDIDGINRSNGSNEAKVGNIVYTYMKPLSGSAKKMPVGYFALLFGICVSCTFYSLCQTFLFASNLGRIGYSYPSITSSIAIFFFFQFLVHTLIAPYFLSKTQSMFYQRWQHEGADRYSWNLISFFWSMFGVLSFMIGLETIIISLVIINKLNATSPSSLQMESSVLLYIFYGFGIVSGSLQGVLNAMMHSVISVSCPTSKFLSSSNIQFTESPMEVEDLKHLIITRSALNAWRFLVLGFVCIPGIFWSLSLFILQTVSKESHKDAAGLSYQMVLFYKDLATAGSVVGGIAVFASLLVALHLLRGRFRRRPQLHSDLTSPPPPNPARSETTSTISNTLNPQEWIEGCVGDPGGSIGTEIAVEKPTWRLFCTLFFRTFTTPTNILVLITTYSWFLLFQVFSWFLPLSLQKIEFTGSNWASLASCGIFLLATLSTGLFALVIKLPSVKRGVIDGSTSKTVHPYALHLITFLIITLLGLVGIFIAMYLIPGGGNYIFAYFCIIIVVAFGIFPGISMYCAWITGEILTIVACQWTYENPQFCTDAALDRFDTRICLVFAQRMSLTLSWLIYVMMLAWYAVGMSGPYILVASSDLAISLWRQGKWPLGSPTADNSLIIDHDGPETGLTGQKESPFKCNFSLAMILFCFVNTAAIFLIILLRFVFKHQTPRATNKLSSN